jgi:hypothetical protein
MDKQKGVQCVGPLSGHYEPCLQIRWCRRTWLTFYILPTNYAILLVFKRFEQLIMYILLLLPSLMTENTFWTSEKQLLTTFTLTTPTRKIYCFHWNRPRSTPFAWRKDTGKGAADRAAFCVSVGEWVNSHWHPFFLLTCNHWKIKLMTCN